MSRPAETIAIVFDSQAQLAAATGWSLAFISGLKKRGCPGFRSGRIYLLEVLVFIEREGREPLEMNKEEAQTFESIERGKTLRIERLRLEGELMDKAEAIAEFNSMHLPVRQRLLSLAPEMAARCNPTDPDLARTELEQWTESTMRGIVSDLEQMEKKADGTDTPAV